MKNSTLLFRSLFFIILIAGSAHLVTFASQKNTIKSNTLENRFSLDTTLQKDKYESKVKNNIINSNTDYLIGSWKVMYNSKDFKGAIVYEIIKENDMYNAYIMEYQDENGNSQKAKKIKTLVINPFKGYKGKAQYMITYEGENYDVECDINIIDDNIFKLSYDSYGYSDIETWKKQ